MLRAISASERNALTLKFTGARNTIFFTNPIMKRCFLTVPQGETLTMKRIVKVSPWGTKAGQK
jgi:transcriptional regulator